MKPPVDLTPAHLKDEATNSSAIAITDLSCLSYGQVRLLLDQKIISIPVLNRNLIALRQNGIEKVLLHYGPEQEEIRLRLEKNPLVGNFLVWNCTQEQTSYEEPLRQQMNRRGCYWINPHYLINGVFLKGFEKAMVGICSSHERISNSISQKNLCWLSPQLLSNMKTQGFQTLFSQLRSLPFKEVVIEDSEVRGLEIQKPQDVPAAEKILFTDVTRKKGGYLAKILNEPISLWIAKHLAKTSIRPNTVTLWNTLLGLLSAYLVYYGAKSGLYGPLALGGILFYLVDIFDGIDGELARFTFRLDKNGALYDTISDNVILIVFLGASTYAAYMQFHHWVVIALGGFTLWTALVTILYLYYFTMKHFGNASLRLYESLFMPKIPRENKFIRFVFSIRKLYTKDILAALITAALILNQPIIIMIGAPVLITLLIIGFFYMGTRYQYLLGSMSPSEI